MDRNYADFVGLNFALKIPFLRTEYCNRDIVRKLTTDTNTINFWTSLINIVFIYEHFENPRQTETIENNLKVSERFLSRTLRFVICRQPHVKFQNRNKREIVDIG